MKREPIHRYSLLFAARVQRRLEAERLDEKGGPMRPQ